MVLVLDKVASNHGLDAGVVGSEYSMPSIVAYFTSDTSE